MGEQIITTSNGERLVVIPEAEFVAMREALEDRDDVEAVRTFQRKLASGAEELIPAEFVNRMIDGENRVRVWREFRSISARDLAESTGLSAAYISEIETGRKEGSISSLKKIAAALEIDLDHLV